MIDLFRRVSKIEVGQLDFERLFKKQRKHEALECMVTVVGSPSNKDRSQAFISRMASMGDLT